VVERESSAGGALSRRSLGAGGLILAAPQLWLQSDASSTTPPEQIHLQFGEDASRQVVVSWATATNVSEPRLRLGTPHDGFGRTVKVETRT
jgi:hypothetical protein